MKYPNPTFLQKASKIKHTRRNRAIAIISIVAVVTFVCIFISSVAAKQKLYRERFPELVGAATSTRATTEEDSDETETSEIETEPSPTPTPLGPVPVIGTTNDIVTESTVITDEEGNPVTTTTVQVNTPSAFIEAEQNTYFYNYHPLQTITHEDRDMMLDDLKQLVQDYIRNASGTRISFRYINLQSNEELGINELNPIVPAAAYNLPIEIIFWQKQAEGRISLNSVSTYHGEPIEGFSSWIADNYTIGKQFFTREIAYLAIARNDNIATAFMIDKLGGMDRIYPSIADISAYIGYTSNVNYVDYAGVRQSGGNRTSIYDMANYASYLYTAYHNYPDTYQRLINDMAASEIATPYRTSFGDNSLILHAAGRNDTMHAYTDVAIIDCAEPIVLAIYVECSDYDRACTIMADLSTYVARYIGACHS